MLQRVPGRGRSRAAEQSGDSVWALEGFCRLGPVRVTRRPDSALVSAVAERAGGAGIRAGRHCADRLWASRAGSNGGARPRAGELSRAGVHVSALFDGGRRRAKSRAQRFEGKIVLIGATATGIGDLRTTPYGGLNYPGVEIHAN